MQTHAHGNALLPQVDEEHRPKHLGLELRAVNPREREEYRELEEADGVHGRPWEAHNVQARIFHEPGRGERFRLRHLDGSRGDAHGGCVSAPNRAATVAEARVGQGKTAFRGTPPCAFSRPEPTLGIMRGGGSSENIVTKAQYVEKLAHRQSRFFGKGSRRLARSTFEICTRRFGSRLDAPRRHSARKTRCRVSCVGLVRNEILHS